MAGKTKRAVLKLTGEQHDKLKKIAGSHTAPARENQRARILLSYAASRCVTTVFRNTGASTRTVYKCIDKALAMGPDAGLRDYWHRPFKPLIDNAAKAWVRNLACTKPKEHGYAAELWSLRTLAQHTREHAPREGYGCLSRASKSTVWRILDGAEIKPHKVKYYLERRDPEFDEKTREVLIVYKEVETENALQKSDPDHRPTTVALSVDEKPGLQALEGKAPELPPRPGRHSSVGRDYEYIRRGTVSLLAGMDLHDGHIVAQVHDRHRSREFVELLKKIDGRYPKDAVIGLILDNRSSHVSQETMTFLSGLPGRFVYVHTPKHGSWLNLIETVFSRMARGFLRHIRVESKEELKERILKGISEMNADPVIHRWKKFDPDIG